MADRVKTLKLYIRVSGGRTQNISDRVSIRTLKLSNFERFRTLKILLGWVDVMVVTVIIRQISVCN